MEELQTKVCTLVDVQLENKVCTTSVIILRARVRAKQIFPPPHKRNGSRDFFVSVVIDSVRDYGVAIVIIC